MEKLIFLIILIVIIVIGIFESFAYDYLQSTKYPTFNKHKPKQIAQGGYVVHASIVVKRALKVMMILGLLMILLCLIGLMVPGDNSALIDILKFGIVFSSIGLLNELTYYRRRVFVYENEIVICYFFKKRRRLRFDEIEKVVVNQERHLLIYVDGKKIRDVAPIYLGCNDLLEDFKRKNVLIEDTPYIYTEDGEIKK